MRLQELYPCEDLEPRVRLDTNYRGLGIDRAVACLSVEDGLVVDAGSAITVDVIQGGVHLGGYILPGIGKYQRLYAAVSPRLKKAINFAVEIDSLPAMPSVMGLSRRSSVSSGRRQRTNGSFLPAVTVRFLPGIFLTHW